MHLRQLNKHLSQKVLLSLLNRHKVEGKQMKSIHKVDTKIITNKLKILAILKIKFQKIMFKTIKLY